MKWSGFQGGWFSLMGLIRRKFNTLKSKIILYFSLVIILCISVIGYIFYTQYAGTVRNNIETSTITLQNQVTSNFDTYFSDMETSLRILSTNKLLVSSILNFNNNTDYTNLQNKEALAELFGYITSNKYDLDDIFVYNEDTYFSRVVQININAPSLRKLWWDFLNDDSGYIQSKFIATHDTDYLVPTSQKVMTIAVPIRDLQNFSTQNIAVAVFDYNLSQLQRMLDRIKRDQNIDAFMTDKDGNMVYATDATDLRWDDDEKAIMDPVYQNQSGIFRSRIHDVDYLISYSTSTLPGWKIVFKVPLSELDKKLKYLKSSIIILLVVMILVTIALSTVISIRNTRPIRELIGYMRVVGNGDFDVRIPAQDNYYEIDMLNKRFNGMLDKIRSLIQEVFHQKILQKEAEFEALQAQIHPHFLYNTLQSINSLAMLNRTRDIQNVTTALGNLLEYSIYHQKDMVEMTRELQNAEHYMKIQNIRYDNRLVTEIDLEEEAGRCYILKLILQPLVENAIYHGLEEKDGEWLIRIQCMRQDDFIRIDIYDNGIGMEPEMLERIRASLDETEQKGENIGLMNIHQRIKIRFGPRYGLEIESSPGVGTTVSIKIPVIEQLSKEE